MRPSRATIRFYAELNDFLPPEERQRDIEVSFFVSPSIKDAIEALGIPHVEVDLILVERRSVGFGYRLEANERVSVYPVFESLDVASLTRLQDRPLRRPTFVADVHLRKLAKLLRLLGLDVLHSNSYTNSELVSISKGEDRILLTRDRMLLKHGDLTHGYWVRSIYPQVQAVEVLRRFDLSRHVSPFTRCPLCNGLLQRIAKADALDRIPPKTAVWLDDYFECTTCEKLYWHGTHAERIDKLVTQIVNDAKTR
ncbi:Mut7-C RNAse domain-containing protein [Candidatus Bipolaricaulota bacterium]